MSLSGGRFVEKKSNYGYNENKNKGGPLALGPYTRRLNASVRMPQDALLGYESLGRGIFSPLSAFRAHARSAGELKAGRAPMVAKLRAA